MKKILNLFLLSMLSYSANFAQDVHFIQTNMVPQLMNPGATGVFGGWERVTLGHRQQWMTMGSPFVTSQFAADFNFLKGNGYGKKGYLGAGINVYNDVAGDAKLGTTQFSLSVAGVLNLNRESSLSLGIQGGGAQRSAHTENLIWANQFDGETFDTELASNEANAATSFFQPDFGSGLYYDYHGTKTSFKKTSLQNFYAGVSMFHLTSPVFKYYNGSSDKLHKKIVGMIGADVALQGTKFAITPRVAYTKQAASQELLITLGGKYELKQGTKYTGIYNSSYLTFGINYRNKDAIAPMFGVEISGWTVTAAYEINISPLKTASKSQGGFEIALSWANLNSALFKGRRGKGFQKPSGM